MTCNRFLQWRRCCLERSLCQVDITVSVSIAACVRYDAQACVEWHLALWMRYGGLNSACPTDLIKIDVGMIYRNMGCLWCIKAHLSLNLGMSNHATNTLYRCHFDPSMQGKLKLLRLKFYLQ